MEIELKELISSNKIEKELSLSKREIEIIKLCAFGFTYKEIAKKLHLAPCTIIKHKKNAIRKTGLKNTAALVYFSTKSGLIQWKIYPIWGIDKLNISIEGVSGEIQLKIFDVHGNDYRFFKIEGTHNIITKKLDLKELPAGVYFVSFSGKDLSEVRKIVVQ